MNKFLFSAALLAFSSMVTAEEYVTPADLTAEQSDEMYNIITEYNGCMMHGRLQPQKGATSGQDMASQLMQSCETHLDALKLHLTENNVEPSLVEGMAKKMRSRAARKMMTQTMNNLAAQAQAMGNAEKQQNQEQAAE
ncbi:hypothetical protein [Methylophaga sp.]|uniref:hypothetical protein n=1 Tax=Methylophaga sp. TaxID=2024840 RepID=UPI003F69D882